MYCFANMNGSFKATQEINNKWHKQTLTYTIINGTEDIHKGLRAAFNLAMTTWDVQIPIDLYFVREGPADITLEFTHDDPYFTSEGILAYAYYPGQGSVSGKIVFNDNVLWSRDGKPISAEEYTRITGRKVQFPNNKYATFNFIHTAIHEIGHALGLTHSNEKGDIMYPYYNGVVHLSDNDKERIHNKYGKSSVPKRLMNWLYRRKQSIVSM